MVGMSTNLDPDKVHVQFHDILGHLTTIRAAIWEINQAEIPQTLQESVTVADNHAEKLVTEIEQLRTDIYKEIDH